MHRKSPLLAQGCHDPAAPYWSAYWGAPAARTCAGEVVGATESDPELTLLHADCHTARASFVLDIGLPCTSEIRGTGDYGMSGIHSALIFAALMMGHHFSISAF